MIDRHEFCYTVSRIGTLKTENFKVKRFNLKMFKRFEINLLKINLLKINLLKIGNLKIDILKLKHVSLSLLRFTPLTIDCIKACLCQKGRGRSTDIQTLWLEILEKGRFMILDLLICLILKRFSPMVEVACDKAHIEYNTMYQRALQDLDQSCSGQAYLMISFFCFFICCLFFAIYEI